MNDTSASSTGAHTNETDADQSTSTKQSLLITKLIFFCIISTAGIIGNVAIITTLLRHKRKSSEYFILNLAITDLMVCTIGIPLDMYEQLHGTSWPYGEFLCRIIYPFQTLCVLISIMTLTVMSLERYRAIMTPLKPLLSKTVLLPTIACIWIIGIGIVAPYANILTYPMDGFCNEKWPGASDGDYYTLALFIIDYCVPLTIITYCYSRAGFELYKRTKEFARQNRRVSCHSQHRALRKRTQRNKRVIKVFSLVVLVFVVCMLPGDAYWMWISFGNGSSFAFENHFKTFTNIIVYANSAINPYIFGACHMAAFRKLGGCRRKTRTVCRQRCFQSSSVRTWNQQYQEIKTFISGPERETRV